MAAVIRKAIIKSYDAQAHQATVQIAGSLGVWLPGVRVATDIPAADVVAGRQCTVLFLDPSNPDDAVVITIQGATPSGGGGGATTFTALTDTPGNYSDAALKTLRVNAGEDAVEFWDLLGTANAWGALQTFSAGLQLAAGQAVKDSGGTARYTPATASPHNTLSGDVRIDGHAAIDSAPKTNPDTKLNISPTPGGATNWRGINIVPTVTLTGSTTSTTGVFGSAVINIPSASSGHVVRGLDFVAAPSASGAGCAVSIAEACSARPFAFSIGSGKALAVTDFAGFATAPCEGFTVIFGTLAITSLYGLNVKGATLSNANITITTAYGVHIGDFTGSSFANVHLLEVGPSTPYLRVVGGGNPGAGLTNLYLNENGTLRRVQWKAGDTLGAGDRVMVLV